MSNINAQSIINEVMQAHAVAPSEYTWGDKITFRTSARGSHRILNCKENLMRFADLVRKNAAAFGGGLIREEKAKPAIVWPSKTIALFKQCMEDNDYQAAFDIGTGKLGALFFVDCKGRACMQVAPMPLDSEPRLVSVLNEDGKWSVCCPISMLGLDSLTGNKRSRQAQIDAAAQHLRLMKPEKKEATMANAHARPIDQSAIRAQWMREHGIVDDAAIEARIEANAAQDVAQIVAQAVAVSAIAEAMAPSEASERMYHVDAVNMSTGMHTRITRYAMDHAHCMTFISKQVPRDYIRHEVMEESTPEIVTCEAVESEAQGTATGKTVDIVVYPSYMVALGLAPSCGFSTVEPTIPPSGGNAVDTTTPAGTGEKPSILGQTFEQWLDSSFEANPYKQEYMTAFQGHKNLAMLGACIGNEDRYASRSGLIQAAKTQYFRELMMQPRDAVLSLAVWDSVNSEEKVELQKHFYSLDGQIIRRTQEQCKAKVQQETAPVTPTVAISAEPPAPRPMESTNFAADIPLSLAVSAFGGVSMSPERRGASAQAGYAQDMAQDYETMRIQAVKGGTLDLLPEVFARYRGRQAGAYRAYLASSSRCVSSFIAGPSNFPAARMNKRNDIAHRRLTEYLDGGKMAMQAAIRTLRPDLRAIMAGDADAIDRLAVKIANTERSQERMKEANKAIRTHAKSGHAHQVEALMALGFTETQSIELIKPDFCGRIGFANYQLTNNNANIRRMKERLESISKAQATEVHAVECSNGITLEDDAPANRVRLYFPGKPDATIRADLKSNGFRWAPSIGAWQAYRNHHTVTTAKRLAGEVVRVKPQEDAYAAYETTEAMTPAVESTNDAAPEAEPVPVVEIEATTPAMEIQPEPVAPVVEIEAQQVTTEPAATPDDTQKFRVRAKSGEWRASFMMIGTMYALLFNGDGSKVTTTTYATHQERMQALEAMARATTPPDTPPDGGLPIATVDAPTDAPTPPVAECTPGATVAVSSAEFERIKQFNMDPRKLLEHGVQAAQLIGLGVKYTGNISSPDGRGAITSVLDTRGDKCGSLRMDCTLEDGRVIHATPFYFTAELRPICQFDGKMHGAPYLAELAMAATLAKSQRTSAEELKKQAHAQALIDLAAKYPQLKRADSTSYGGTFAAKNIRILLKEAFKGQKFSVTSDYNQVRVNWIDGPTDAQVNEVIARFDIGASDMDTDYFYTVKTAFSELFGGVQYLSTTRETSDVLIQQAINQLYQNEATRPTVNDWRKAEGVFDWRGNDYAIRQMRETLTGMSAYTAPKAKAKA